MRADTNYNFAKEITKHFRKHTIGAFVHSYPNIVVGDGLRSCVAKIAKMYFVCTRHLDHMYGAKRNDLWNIHLRHWMTCHMYDYDLLWDAM